MVLIAPFTEYLPASTVVGALADGNAAGATLTTTAMALVALLAVAALLVVVLRQGPPAPLATQTPPQPAAEPTPSRPAVPSALRAMSPTGTILVPLDSLLTHVGRELRAELTTLLGNADLLLDPGIGGPQRADRAIAIVRQGQRLAGLVATIEDLGALARGTHELREDTLALDAICHDAIAANAASAKERGIELRVHGLASTPCWRNGDATALRRILDALLQHAIERTTTSVRLTVRLDDQAVALRVEDDGPELPTDALDHAFDAIWALQPVPAAEPAGFGLALALAKHLALRLRGDLIARPGPGQGLVFDLQLPLPAAEPWQIDLEEGDSFQRSLAATPERRGGLRGSVLLVEDARDQQLVIGRLLQRAGAEVTIAASGELALQLLEHQSFDLVLMDLHMPGLDGLQTTRRLRERMDQTPVVALTADNLAGDAERSMLAGCNSHLAKPVDAATLEQTLTLWLRPTATAAATAEDDGA